MRAGGGRRRGARLWGAPRPRVPERTRKRDDRKTRCSCPSGSSVPIPGTERCAKARSRAVARRWRCVGAVLPCALAGVDETASRPPPAGVAGISKYGLTTVTKLVVAIPLASLVALGLASRCDVEVRMAGGQAGPDLRPVSLLSPRKSPMSTSTHPTTLFRGRLMQLRLHAAANAGSRSDWQRTSSRCSMQSIITRRTCLAAS